MAITGIKGCNDILPGDVDVWQRIEATARQVFSLYGFSEIRLPILEKTELFCRSIGDCTDIVEKEMYSFVDKGDNRVTMRPEGTAAVMRSYIEHKMYAQDPVTSLYYIGPMFRYERPQKGRYRQFHQIGAEVVGVHDPLVDAQILVMLRHLFTEFGLTEPRLEINSLGCPACRPAYRDTLLAFLQSRRELLCDDCQRRLLTNPLRAIDCKVPGCRDATLDAPAMLDHLCSECDSHFSRTKEYLDEAGAEYTINCRMVRGLDYYTRTTFELVTGLLGAQSAVAAGGRYDGLVEALGGPSLPGIGFALGIERVALLMKGETQPSGPDLFIAALGDEARKKAFSLMSALQQSSVHVALDYEGKSLKSQMRRADKLQAAYTLILGETELASGQVVLKRMSDGSQQSLPLDLDALRALLLPR